jgi:hypothetical protein
MKLFLTSLLFVFAVSGFVNAQDDSWLPPKPMQNAIYEAMVGEWTGESDMGGMKMQEEMKIYWTLNRQFLITEFKGTNPHFSFTGMAIMGVDSKGNPVSWWFDDWGADAVMQGSGSFIDGGLTITSTGKTMKDTRTYTMKDGKMIMVYDSQMEMNGQPMNMKGETVYTKR